MRYLEWAVMFLVAGLGICLANLVGFKVNFFVSLPGVLILLAISFASVILSKIIPLKHFSPIAFGLGITPGMVLLGNTKELRGKCSAE